MSLLKGLGSRRLPQSPLRNGVSSSSPDASPVGSSDSLRVAVLTSSSSASASAPATPTSPALSPFTLSTAGSSGSFSSGGSVNLGGGSGTPVEDEDVPQPTLRSRPELQDVTRSFSGSSLSLKRNSAFSKQVDLEGQLYFSDAIKLNSKGMPQSRAITLTKSTLYISTPKKKCKRIIPLANLQGVSMTPHWDSLVCIHVVDAIDVLLICPDKGEFVAALTQAYVILTSDSLVPQVCEVFEFKPRPGGTQKLAFYLPDGTERKSARIFVDWQDQLGNSINPSSAASCALSANVSPDITPNSSPPSSPRMTAYGLRESMMVGDGLDDGDSEDEITEKKVRVRGSTLLSKMMNIIPVNERKQPPSKLGTLIDRMTDSSDSYVFYKWLLDPIETNPTGMKVREWQLQGGRNYMEDVLSIEYNLKYGLGDLYVSLFDGHGGRGASDWLGNHLQGIIEKKYLKQETKDMRACLATSFQKAQKKLLQEKSVGDAGSTALVTVFRKNKIYIANCGDTRAVIYKSTHSETLTTDHRVSNSKENRRLVELGATIKKDRIYCGHWDINLARSLGDRQFLPYVIAEPDIFEYKIDEDDEFLVIATDGVWDVVRDEDVGRTVRQTGDPKKICSLASALGSRDNLSAVVIFLKQSA